MNATAKPYTRRFYIILGTDQKVAKTRYNSLWLRIFIIFIFLGQKNLKFFFYKNPIIQRLYQYYADKNGKFSSASKFYENLKKCA